MKLTEKQISTKRIYEGRVIKIRVDDVLLENGETAKREVVEHNGAVCVVPITDDNMIYMVRQFRYPFNETILEVPAGKLNGPDEVWADAAVRELEEETGMKTDNLIYIGDYYPSVAFLTEVIHMYVAKGLKNGSQCLDEDEFLEVEKHSLSSLVEMIMSGEIKDGKTISAILKVNNML